MAPAGRRGLGNLEKHVGVQWGPQVPAASQKQEGLRGPFVLRPFAVMSLLLFPSEEAPSRISEGGSVLIRTIFTLCKWDKL